MTSFESIMKKYIRILLGITLPTFAFCYTEPKPVKINDFAKIEGSFLYVTSNRQFVFSDELLSLQKSSMTEVFIFRQEIGTTDPNHAAGGQLTFSKIFNNYFGFHLQLTGFNLKGSGEIHNNTSTTPSSSNFSQNNLISTRGKTKDTFGLAELSLGALLCDASSFSFLINLGLWGCSLHQKSSLSGFYQITNSPAQAVTIDSWILTESGKAQAHLNSLGPKIGFELFASSQLTSIDTATLNLTIDLGLFSGNQHRETKYSSTTITSGQSILIPNNSINFENKLTEKDSFIPLLHLKSGVQFTSGFSQMKFYLGYEGFIFFRMNSFLPNILNENFGSGITKFIPSSQSVLAYHGPIVSVIFQF